MKMLKDNVLSQKFLAIDIETTCLSPDALTAGIIEVYAGIYSKGSLTDKFHSLYFHENSDDTYEFHHINKHAIRNKPRFENADNDELVRLINECCDPNGNLTFMAHYVPFEYMWLKRFLGNRVHWKGLRVCDTRDMYKYIMPNAQHGLRFAAKDLCGLEPDGSWAFHRAKDDVSAMVTVYSALLEEVSADDLNDYNSDTYEYSVSAHLHDRADSQLVSA